MRIVSVNVGLPREVVWKSRLERTAIFKEPVAGPIAVNTLNLAGDRQADLSVHGGPEKAVYAYPIEHYDFWRTELAPMQLAPGNFGENLTTEGLSEDTLCIGDQLQIGSAVLTVTQPRVPCYKLALRFGRDNIIQRFLYSGRSGFYFAVDEEGEVRAGSKIEILRRDPERVTVADINKLFLGKPVDPDLLDRVLRVLALPEGWRQSLVRRSGR